VYACHATTATVVTARIGNNRVADTCSMADLLFPGSHSSTACSRQVRFQACTLITYTSRMLSLSCCDSAGDTIPAPGGNASIHQRQQVAGTHGVVSYALCCHMHGSEAPPPRCSLSLVVATRPARGSQCQRAIPHFTRVRSNCSCRY
jgi:hypothetical protein